MLLLEFWKPNCMYCGQLAPLIDEIETQFKDRLKIKRINTNECPDLSQVFKIKSVPTLILMKDGKELKRTSGAKSRAALQEFLQMG